MDTLAINIYVGETPFRLCYDRDNERMVLVPLPHVQPNESQLFSTVESALSFLNSKDYENVTYSIVYMNQHGEF